MEPSTAATGGYGIAGAPLLHLNVGGRRFTTTKSTLCSRPESYFTGLLSGNMLPSVDPSGCLFIDRSGTHFHHILEYLRSGACPQPADDMELAAIVREAEFYSLFTLAEHLRARKAADRQQVKESERQGLQYDGHYIYHPAWCCQPSLSLPSAKKSGGGGGGGRREADSGRDRTKECVKVLITFSKGGNFKTTAGYYAENDMKVLQTLGSLPPGDPIRENCSTELALYVRRTLLRGTYEYDGWRSLALRFSTRDPVVPGVAVGESLFLPTAFVNLQENSWHFREFVFHPWTKPSGPGDEEVAGKK